MKYKEVGVCPKHNNTKR